MCLEMNVQKCVEFGTSEPRVERSVLGSVMTPVVTDFFIRFTCKIDCNFFVHLCFILFYRKHKYFIYFCRLLEIFCIIRDVCKTNFLLCSVVIFCRNYTKVLIVTT